MGGIEHEVSLLPRVGLEVVELVEIPDAVALDELVGRGAEGEHGRRLRVRVLPEVFVEQPVAPRRLDGPAGGEIEEAAARHGGWRGDAGRGQERGGDVDAGDHLVADSACRPRAGADAEERHPHRLLVGRPLVDEAVLTPEKAVVAHVDDHRRVGEAVLGEPRADAGHRFVHREERLALGAVEIGEWHRVLEGELGAVPAVSLVSHPEGLSRCGIGLLRVCHEGRERLVAVAADMPGRRLEVAVDPLVREVGEEGLVVFRRGREPVEAVVGKFVGDVALLRHRAAVEIEHGRRPVGPRRAGQVGAVATERHPAVEAGLRRVGRLADVPLAEESRAVADPLQQFGKEHRAGAEAGSVVDHAVGVGVVTGEDRRTARRAERRRHECIPEPHAVAGERVEPRRLDEGMARASQKIVAVVVGEDKDDVPRSGGLSRFRGGLLGLPGLAGILEGDHAAAGHDLPLHPWHVHRADLRA